MHRHSCYLTKKLLSISNNFLFSFNPEPLSTFLLPWVKISLQQQSSWARKPSRGQKPRNVVVLQTAETFKKSCCSCPPTIWTPLDVEAATKYGSCSGRSGVLPQCNDVIFNKEDDRKCLLLICSCWTWTRQSLQSSLEGEIQKSGLISIRHLLQPKIQ